MIDTKNTKTVVYPGTFDPITLGHLDIIQRAAKIFDTVIVAVAANPTKQPVFSLAERLALIDQAVAHLPNVTSISFTDLLVNKFTAPLILLRGLRSVADFEYEVQLAHINKKLSESMPDAKDGMETIFLPPSSHLSYVSSTIVKEIIKHGGDVSNFVQEHVKEALQEKFPQ